MDYQQYFKRGSRTDTGLSYYFLIDETPDELKELVYEIHQYFESPLNDWIYEQIYEAFVDLKTDSLDDCSIEADVHSELYKWLGNSFADIWCTEVLECHTYKNIWAVISEAQYIAKRKIYAAVDAFITYKCWMNPPFKI